MKFLHYWANSIQSPGPPWTQAANIRFCSLCTTAWTLCAPVPTSSWSSQLARQSGHIVTTNSSLSRLAKQNLSASQQTRHVPKSVKTQSSARGWALQINLVRNWWNLTLVSGIKQPSFSALPFATYRRPRLMTCIEHHRMQEGVNPFNPRSGPESEAC